MKRAINKIKTLIERNAIHRKGFCLQDVTLPEVLVHAQEELQELAAAPDDPTEMADLLAILFHYSIQQGWTPEFLQSLIIEKLDLRFKEPT